MDENNLNRYDNASSGSLSTSNLPRVDSTYASAETSPRSSLVSSASSSLSNFVSIKDEILKRDDDLDSQKLTVNESIIKEHKEKMQKIAVGIREYAFGKDKQQASPSDSPVCDGKPGSDQATSQQFSFSLIDKMLARNGESSVVAKTTSPLGQVVDGHARVHEHAATASAESPMHSNNSTLSAASSSSPNPDFSPFKLLSNEVHAAQQNSNHLIHSLASAMANAGMGGAQKPSLATDRVVIANSIVESSSSSSMSKPTIETLSTNKIIENLTSLSRKDHERADPILSAAKNSSDSPASLPASSREFCMNLNLNLAVAAAATASGPVAIVDNTKPVTMLNGVASLHQQYLEHSKFTSNASTSSIHNDLKAILEESLNKNQVNYGGALDKRNEMPKPQRVAQNPVLGDKAQQKPQVTKVVLSTPAPPDLHATKSSNIDLSKYMQMLIESKNKPLSAVLPSKPTSYRYSREFLYQIREQRAEFIQQIYPDIFQAYSYCSNGDFWDPEKYFDIIQFPTEDERLQNLQQKQQMQAKHNYKNYQQKMNAKNGKNSYQQKFFGNLVQSPSIESPKPLQVPKNSPRMQMDSESDKAKQAGKQHQQHQQQQKNKNKMPKQSKKISTSVLTSLGLAEEMKISSDEIDESTLLGYSSGGHMISSMINSNNSDADKILLSLLKSSDQAKKAAKSERTTPAGGRVDLLDMLNKQPKNKTVETSVKPEPVDIVKNMFQKESMKHAQPKPSVPRHFPQIFSVQELEMDQASKMKQQASKLPTSAQQLETKQANDESAYKKLLLNLNKEQPKQPTSHLNSLFSKLDSKQASQKPSAQVPQQSVANEGTKILKQLLNLNPNADSSAEQAKEKKAKKQHRHHKRSSKSSEKNASPNTSQSSEPQQAQQKSSYPELTQAQVLDKYALNKKTVDTNAHIENLLNKINESKHREHKKHHDQAKQQKDHFNSLLTKIQGAREPAQVPSVPAQQPAQADKSADILKWFTKAEPARPQQSEKTMPANWTSLSEIELMQKQRPLICFGQTH